MDVPVIRHGVDIIEISRVQKAVDRYGDRFLVRIYTPLELKECQGNMSSLAARFAAKEAVAKALGTGIGDICWGEIEISRGIRREPQLNLYGSAAHVAETQGLKYWAVSLSHTDSLAIASVVVFGRS